MALALPAIPTIAEGLGAFLAWVGIGALTVVATVKAIDIIDDYLDEKTTQNEIDQVLEKVGDVSRAARRRVDVCEECKWCQIVIQAQGLLIGSSTGSTVSLGPYFVQGRTVSTTEGITVLGATHVAVQKAVSNRAFRDIAQLSAFGKTASYIKARPPTGLPPGEHRAGGIGNPGRFCYDINVTGNLNAFMV